MNNFKEISIDSDIYKKYQRAYEYAMDMPIYDNRKKAATDTALNFSFMSESKKISKKLMLTA